MNLRKTSSDNEHTEEVFLHDMCVSKFIQVFNQASPCSIVLLDKLIVPQLVKKLPAFYGIPGFITLFMRARHLFLS